MRAIIWTKYGSPDGLQLQEVEKPTPADNEVLIKTHAASVTAADCELRAFKKLPVLVAIPFRLYVSLTRPQRITILGQELAGEIEAAGVDVTKFRVGDKVFAWTHLRLGGHAEYKSLPEERGLAVMVAKPANMTYLDDYHVMDAKPVDNTLPFLLEHLPPLMDLVIPQEDPDLPPV